MGLQAKPIDAALALDILQKLSEEGVRVTLTYQKRDARAPAVGGMYHLKLEGKLWDEGAGEYAETWGVRLEEACETALDIYRRAWIEARPGGHVGDPKVPLSAEEVELVAKAGGIHFQFQCEGPCWKLDCECRLLDGKIDPERRPPLHEGCACVLVAAKPPAPPEGPPLEFVSESGKIRKP